MAPYSKPVSVSVRGPVFPTETENLLDPRHHRTKNFVTNRRFRPVARPPRCKVLCKLGGVEAVVSRSIEVRAVRQWVIRELGSPFRPDSFEIGDERFITPHYS